mmetsp:Transcript_18307/g.44044  ORF Transcript_18307/g.44044 Transcript_18307/m.44044 type:complete len:202 (+) Transcript_18307:918-1523(+)
MLLGGKTVENRRDRLSRFWWLPMLIPRRAKTVDGLQPILHTPSSKTYFLIDSVKTSTRPPSGGRTPSGTCASAAGGTERLPRSVRPSGVGSTTCMVPPPCSEKDAVSSFSSVPACLQLLGSQISARPVESGPEKAAVSLSVTSGTALLQGGKRFVGRLRRGECVLRIGWQRLLPMWVCLCGATPRMSTALKWLLGCREIVW